MGAIGAKNPTKVTVIAEYPDHTMTFTVESPEPGAEARTDYEVPYTGLGALALTARGRCEVVYDRRAEP